MDVRDIIEPQTPDEVSKNNMMKAAIATTYKIHLMPQDKDLLSVMQTLLDLQQQGNVDIFKVLDTDSGTIYNKHQGKYFAKIVIYVKGTDNAQKTLNLLYATFKNLEGLKDKQGNYIVPRYNAKVPHATVLYFAHGDADFKDMPEYQKYYEQPDRIYYAPSFEGSYKNYKLYNPANLSEPLVS